MARCRDVVASNDLSGVSTTCGDTAHCPTRWNGYLAQQQAAQRKYQAEVMTPPLNQNMSK
ncbi:hypothetical protein Sjap_011393 [Stephania japonica]|uniref:Uncharacterized protein n=1 Tax=Stephania japonica TaxID=461633 RepID=A0AAP0JD65_9MAGN